MLSRLRDSFVGAIAHFDQVGQFERRVKIGGGEHFEIGTLGHFENVIGGETLHAHMIAARPKQIFVRAAPRADTTVWQAPCATHGERQHGNHQRRREAQRAHQRRHAEHIAQATSCDRSTACRRVKSTISRLNAAACVGC